MKKIIRLSSLLLAFSMLLTGCSIPQSNLKPAESSEKKTAETQAQAENLTPVQPMTEINHKKTVDEVMADLDLSHKVHQMFIVTPEALTGVGQVIQFGDTSKEKLIEHPVGGLIYFSPNLESEGQVTSMLYETQDFATYSLEVGVGAGLFLSVDEEGGDIARVADSLGTTSINPMAFYGRRGDAEEVRKVSGIIGNDIKKFGFNLDFAPVADVNLNENNELGSRIFSSDPQVTADMVAAYVDGLQSTGVAATLKHFPGLGAEDGNAHTDEAIYIERSLEELRQTEFLPFKSGIGAGADFVMVSHQIVSAVGEVNPDEANLPACLSHTVCTDWLRNELGFQGLIITDSMQMNTISGKYSSAQAAVKAIQAGVDIILMPQDMEEAVQGVLDAIETGEISVNQIDESVRRILNEKEKLGLFAEWES